MGERRSSRSPRGSSAGLHSSGFPDFDDPELELERIFQLNYEAASGELPAWQPPQDSAIQESKVNVDSEKPGQTNPATKVASSSNMRTPVSRALERRKHPVHKGMQESTSVSQFTAFPSVLDDDDDEDQPGSPLRKRARNADDREAEAALIISLQRFIAGDNPTAEDIPAPAALPIPMVGVCDNSALKTFCDQMIDHHTKTEIPLPVQQDIAQFLLQLPDDCPVHLQLPSLAFPANDSCKNDECGYVHMGSLLLDPVNRSAQLSTTVQNHSFAFEISQQSVSSHNASVLVFQMPKEGEECGTASVLTVDMIASLTAQITQRKGLVNGGPTISNKKISSLDHLMKTREDEGISVTSEKRKKAEQMPADTSARSLAPKEAFKKPRRPGR